MGIPVWLGDLGVRCTIVTPVPKGGDVFSRIFENASFDGPVLSAHMQRSVDYPDYFVTM